MSVLGTIGGSVVCCFAALCATARADGPATRSVDFGHDVRPILADKCFRCHGPDSNKRQGGLRLDDEQSAKSNRDGRQAIVSGQAAASELVRRISATDESLRMPPSETGKQLAPAEIELLRRWIAEGAVWAKHWAYELPRRHAAPATNNREWPLQWIDQFVLARIEQRNLQPSPQADRLILMRRLTLDLTGLPPTPEDVDTFVRDSAPDAYEKLVNRLLASETYGERLAAYWLDLVRYADTVGYHGDQEHHISPYRDYVIDALNDNVPFDQFTRDQLAGDLISGSTIEQQVASGYNRLLQTSHEGGVQAKEYLAIYAADRMRNFSAVWLGGTLGCAQCHDHKFDPYTSHDFYSMVAFFADIDEADHLRKGSDSSPTVRSPEIAVLSRRERRQLDAVEAAIKRIRQQHESGGPDPVELADLERQRDAIKKRARQTMITKSIEPRVIRILPRGNWLDDSGPVVEPAVPQFLPPCSSNAGRATRLDLANWLTDAKAGVGLLTARVFVNRLWSLFFGAGIARSLDDFGAQGEPPDCPELLDRLAYEFVESGWDVKRMVRLIVSSRTYRQSSFDSAQLAQVDPENRLWARQSKWRLAAETMRDTALAVSGLLVREVGGASARPYQPDDYYKHLNFPPRKYESHSDSRQWRRGVYVHWQRQYLHPMLKAFDASSREECTAQRPRSNTPLAALVLLNDPSFVEAARVLAARVIQEADSPDARLDYAFRLVLARSPDDMERSTLDALWAASRDRFSIKPAEAEKLLGTGISPAAPELDPVDHAAWTTVSRALLNLNETYQRQ